MKISRRTFLGTTGAAALVAGTGAATAHAAPATNPAAPAVVPTRPTPGSAWQSGLLKMNPHGRLAYPRRGGLRLPDFSHAGYRRGEQDLPDLSVVRTLAPVAGDNTTHIQAALDEVGRRPLDSNGHRGALLLEAGTYDVGGVLRLTASGVVLRGVGDGEDPAANTVLRATTKESVDVIVAGGPRTTWQGEVPGTRTDVLSGRVQVADDSFTVADASGLSVGNNIVIHHPCTEAWLDAIDGGGTGEDAPWEPGFRPIVFNRFITAIRGNRVTVDAPLFAELDRSLAQSYVYVWDRAGVQSEIGIEDLRIDIAFDSTVVDENGLQVDEEHAFNGIRLDNVQNAWVRDCTVLHFEQAGFVTRGTTMATIRNCRAIDPVATLDGSRRYNFNVDVHSQQILFEDCYANGGRHAYVSNGHSTTSGIVMLRTTAEGSYTSSEGHRQWVQGMLFDNHTEIAPNTDRTIGLYNRGDYGTGHGWSSVHSVAWNTDAVTRLVVQQPPTAQNYAIGCFGEVTGDGPFEAPAGHIEGSNRPGLVPESLYEAQLADRLRG